MESRALSLASLVLRQANRERPADGMLREVLRRERGLSPATSALAAGAVFAAGRWQRWLDNPLDVEAALALQQQFEQNPASFSDEELRALAVPDWVREQMPVSTAWVRALQSPPVLWVRARPGRAEALVEWLIDARLSGVLPEAVEYFGQRDLFRTSEFQAGDFELQDICSQAVGPVCGAQSQETWWDACAGEGGKTLLLSDRMQNKGLIWASDRASWRLGRLKLRAARAGVFNYRSAPWEGGAKLPTKTKFDGVLVDAPCSGLGTWQRNPHARWTTTAQDVMELGAVQERLLRHAAPAVKPGGKLVYAACTLTRAETEGVAEAFAKACPEFQPLPVANPFVPGSEPSIGQTWWPQDTRGNGMFVAVWKRGN